MATDRTPVEQLRAEGEAVADSTASKLHPLDSVDEFTKAQAVVLEKLREGGYVAVMEELLGTKVPTLDPSNPNSRESYDHIWPSSHKVVPEMGRGYWDIEILGLRQSYNERNELEPNDRYVLQLHNQDPITTIGFQFTDKFANAGTPIAYLVAQMHSNGYYISNSGDENHQYSASPIPSLEIFREAMIQTLTHPRYIPNPGHNR